MSCYDPDQWNGGALHYFGDKEAQKTFVPLCWLTGIPTLLFGSVVWVRHATGRW
jgi:hypothetical protein